MHGLMREGRQVNVAMIELLRHRQTKGAATDRLDLRCGKPALYSTHYHHIPFVLFNSMKLEYGGKRIVVGDININRIIRIF